MTFADWKKRSKLFAAYKDGSEREGIALEAACAAAYKAGEREGMKIAEAVAMNAIILRQKLGA